MSENAAATKKKIKIKTIETFATLITSAFGLVAALAWNETIKALISEFITRGSGLWGYLVYAVVVTLLAVGATMFISMQAEKLKGSDCDEE